VLGIFTYAVYGHVVVVVDDEGWKHGEVDEALLHATTFFIQNREIIVREFPQLGLAMTVLILMAMSGGVLLALMLRLSGREQRTIIIEIGMQNAAQAISIASSPFVFANDVMAIPAIVYALMMNVILLAYVGGVKMMGAKS
jgi:BASS family bile acid:Na+ symporter